MIENRFEVEEGGYVAATTVTSFRIIEALQRRGGATVAELVEELGLAQGTVYKHLNTLRSIDYVSKDGPEYSLGLAFLELGITARDQQNLYDRTFDTLSRLAETAGGVTTLMVPEHGFGVYLTQIVPEGAAEPPHREGQRVHLHATASGKAILACQPEEMLDAWFEGRELPALTPSTISDPDRLRDELRSIRDRLTAHSRGEQFEDWYSVAVPVTDGDGVAVGAVSITKPVSEMGDSVEFTEFRTLLGSSVDSIESKLSFE